jgi:hypothetical protein
MLVSISIGIMLVLCTFENHSRLGRVLTTGFVLAAVLVGLLNDWLTTARVRGLVLPVMAVYTAILVSCAFSVDSLYSIRNFLYYQHLWFGALLLAIGCWAVEPRRQDAVLRGLMAAGLVSALLGLVAFHTAQLLQDRGVVEHLTDFVHVGRNDDGTFYYRAKGMLESYTRSASVFIMTLPATLALLMVALREKRRVETAVALLTVVLSVWYLLMTKSRGAWLATGVSCVITYLLLRGRAWVPVAAALLMGLIVLAMPATRARALTLVNDLSRPDLFMSGRLDLWHQGLEHIAERPITGIGYGGDIFLTEDGLRLHELRSARLRQPDLHSIYLQTLAETGILGLAAYAWLVAVLLVISYRSMRAARAMDTVSPALAVTTAALPAMLLFGVVYYFNERQVAHMLSVVLGLLLASRRDQAS